ncbi:MAG TPA: hypothetical protein VFA70_14490, partial [Dehalococcoidia bacterium]|nr:hypothetical protein [Dehalococcoidia bacterium]
MERVPSACVQVAGDPTVDWQLTNPTGERLHFSYQWEAQATVRILPRPGGAALLTSSLRRLMAVHAPTVQVAGITLPNAVIFDPTSSITRSFQIWDLFPREVGGSQATWR